MHNRKTVAASFFADNNAQRWVRDRLIELLSSETSVPMFPVAVMKLTVMMQQENVDFDEVVDIVEMDQGLSTRCLRAANSASSGGQFISTIREALFLIGMRELRQLVLTVGVVENFNHLRIKINWQPFWMHSILVARLTEKLAYAFRPVTGLEYLAGLLHDIGKLVLEQYFPREFEQIMMESLQRRCGAAAVENEVIGVDHALIGAAMCQVMNLHPHIVRAVQFHHRATYPPHIGNPAGDKGFLSSCVSVADMLANVGGVNIGGHKEWSGELDQLPEWHHLTNSFSCTGLDLDLDEEIKIAEEKVKAMC